MGFGPSAASDSRSELLSLEVVHDRFKEKPLQTTLHGTASAIRITWMPTFDPPFLVKFDDTRGEVTRTTKQLSGMGGYVPGRLAQVRREQSHEHDFDKLLHILKAYHFWEAPSQDPNKMVSLDGPYITIEAVNNGVYHRITRYSPGDHESESKLVEFLQLATQHYKERQIIRLPWL